ncbi:hypothetical protein CYMTET_26523 [Cymbomonas tetramitiformis]|uniref:NADP-dependent oxidoreductase domain-containing protein n=1 Tax=Cymbomonas tetramitiformis TaxID=36881 RepID=A0AAE0KY60_9CHLO|nr:hypothetical protein CYMTET_26523 [Cymbomonas tetramitiformis]
MNSAIPKKKLGMSDMEVSVVCLGTMTFGVQNTEAEAHAQLDYYIKERKCNFIDTAEMYPVPASASNWAPGKTEEYIGTWLAKNADSRSEFYIATKVSGFNPNSETVGNRTVPPGPAADGRLDAVSIKEACDASLRRLQTPYIDLYQLHWPDRYVANFGTTAYDPSKERDAVPIEETILALKELIDAGKIRYYGLSNETSFGVCEFARVADSLGVPRPVSIQNSFSLVHRAFETDLAEACAPRNHNLGLLPWSPLAGGALSGKYLDGAKPEGSRFLLYPQFMGRFQRESTMKAVEKYQAIADKAGISLATLALAWCKSRWYAVSTIIGGSHKALNTKVVLTGAQYHHRWV